MHKKINQFSLPKFPIQINLLIICAFTRSIAYWSTASYLSVFLMETLGINVENIGLLTGIGSLGGVLTGAVLGFWIDRMNKFKLVNACIILLASMYFLLPWSNNVILILIILLIVGISSTGMLTIYNTWFSILLTVDECKKAFSIKYILENIGAMIGPVLGTLLVVYDIRSPFYIAVIFLIITAAIMLFNYKKFPEKVSVSTIPQTEEKRTLKEEFIETFKYLALDKRLVFFTIGGILSIMVYGALLPFLSQYFLLIDNYKVAYDKVAYVSAENAFFVLVFQYFFTSIIKKERILMWINIAIGCLIAGLIIIAINSSTLWLTISIAFISFGELIIVPAEYLFIIQIAPENMRGSYYGVQNLIFLGMTFSPMLCGFLFNRTTTVFTFMALVVVLLASSLCYTIGYKSNNKINA